MKSGLFSLSFLFTLLSVFSGVFCGVARADISYLSEAEFRALASEMAPRVNLFQEVWQKDPSAVFYGGTTRDYLYWLKGQFVSAQSREQALEIKEKLEKTKIVDVRDFIIGESDVDIVSQNVKIDAARFGVRKIDSIGPDIFNPATELGKNELGQGHIPVEKIQLNKNGLSQIPSLGDGVHEIYMGKLSVRFADAAAFKETKYAKEGVNHPILLALRYLRMQGINYFRTHGAEYPDPKLLLEGMDSASAAEVKKVIDKALNGKELLPYLKKQKFVSWINGTIQKSFRSYTNPTAALEILKKFHVDELSTIYGEELIEPINQYVFIKHRDSALIAENFSKFNVNTKKLFQSPAQFFPDGNLYHGTREERAFRGILFQGILPSDKGSAGDGLYGVAEANKQFSENWAGDKDRLLRFPVNTQAKIVDTTRGEGLRLRKAFGKSDSEFADAFGIDILRYPYDTEAFVVKNSAVLGKAEGVYRSLMPFSELLEKAKTMSAAELMANLEINQLSSREGALLLAETKVSDAELLPLMEAALDKNPNFFLPLLRDTDFFMRNIEKLAPQMLRSKNGALFHGAVDLYLVGKAPFRLSFLQALRSRVPSLGDGGIGLDFETHVVQGLVENRNFSHLAEVLTALERSSPDLASYLTMIGKSRLSEKEWEKIPNFIGLKNVNNVALRSTTFYAIFQRVFLSNPSAEFAKPLAEEMKRRPREFSQELANAVLNKWSEFPEIIEGYLGHSDYEIRLMLEKMMALPGWSENDWVVGKFLAGAHGKSLESVNGLEQPGWSADIIKLREVFEHADDHDLYPKAVVSRALLPYLTKNNLWEKDPGLLVQVIEHGNLNRELAAIAELPGLERHPQVMNALTERLHLFFEKRNAITQRLITEPEWANHPEVVRKIMSYSPHDFMKMAQEILSSPNWAGHPELVEEFAAKAANWKGGREALRELLSVPQWRDHPAFASLKTGGNISTLGLWQRGVAAHPEEKKLFSGLKVRCDSFFRLFSPQNLP